MSRVTDYIKNNIVATELRNSISNSLAIITSYDKTSNTASIKYYSPSTSGAYITKSNVKISTETEGIVSSSLKEGDMVLINFISDATPVVIRKVEEFQEGITLRSKHKRKGGCIPYSMGGV